MPLKEPDNLREKIILIGSAGAGKTTAWLSIAWWAAQTDDPRQFYVCDTDDEAVFHVMNEEKYAGMLAENGGNVHVTSCVDWDEMAEWSEKSVSLAKKGDWIVVDFISHWWPAVQEGFLKDAANKTRGEVLYEAGVKGATGWDMFKEEFNWNAINGSYFDATKPIWLKTRAHVFMTGEEDVIQESSRMTDDAKEHVAQFGKYKVVGQKKLPFQCRSYLRTQRLARGRVLYTLKDRAREEFSGQTVEPDFFSMYLKGAAGWTLE